VMMTDPKEIDSQWYGCAFLLLSWDLRSGAS